MVNDPPKIRMAISLGMPAILSVGSPDTVCWRIADRARADRTARNALEYSRTGETVRWRNPDSGHSGTFTPTRTYRTASGRNCREYQTSVTVGGRNTDAYGTACRQGDGTWKITQ